MGKLRALADQKGTRTLSDDGDVEDALAKADHVIERYFQTPYLAHLPMAPMNAVANVHDGKIEIWAPSATPAAPFADILLEMSMLEHPEDLVIYQPYIGDQFGRANDWDFFLLALVGSQQAGVPVKVIYDRVTDTRVCTYYPAGGYKMRVGVDKSGMPVAWQIH
jgi:isoquinoline 1-oxidoreductase beta subunit